MSEPFLAEVKIVGFNFAPRGWAFCDGQILPINQNQSLYSLLGTTYGGDGRTTFALPDLRGRTPIHVGGSDGVSHKLGQRGGEEAHTLAVQEMPSHHHGGQGINGPNDDADPEDRLPAIAEGNTYRPDSTANTTVVPMGATSTNDGGGQAHENMQPYLAVNFCIALQGLFPSRN
ncbi:MAG: phage tail protein [Chloroflexi bacterium]|nr:phage tail protein [Chloroflexota bacterium]